MSNGIFCSKVQIEREQLESELNTGTNLLAMDVLDDDAGLVRKRVMQLFIIDLPLKYIWSKNNSNGKQIITEEFFGALGNSHFELFRSVVI
jgi:hypothetical protein